MSERIVTEDSPDIHDHKVDLDIWDHIIFVSSHTAPGKSVTVRDLQYLWRTLLLFADLERGPRDVLKGMQRIIEEVLASEERAS